MRKYSGYREELAELKIALINISKTSSYIHRRINYITNKLTEFNAPPQTIEDLHNLIELSE